MNDQRLKPALMNELQRFAASDVLVAFDFDGVLAPIVADRSRSRIPGRLRQALVGVARRYPCVVVSGRSLADLESRLDGIPLRAIYANFGYEPAPPDGRPPAAVGEWTRILRLRLASEPGVQIEDKRYSIAVHYREARNRAAARRAIARATALLSGARVLEGTLAVTLLPRRGPNKGTALQRARRQWCCRTAIYVGDDGTDEDAFTSAPPSSFLSVRVGGGGVSAARYRLGHQREVLLFLRALRSLRRLR